MAAPDQPGVRRSRSPQWLLDWHAMRGINLFSPHAFFYSVHDRRAFESEPDLGVHNPWWPYWGPIADYVRRLCWLFTDAEEACEAAMRMACARSRCAWSARLGTLPVRHGQDAGSRAEPGGGPRHELRGQRSLRPPTALGAPGTGPLAPVSRGPRSLPRTLDPAPRRRENGGPTQPPGSDAGDASVQPWRPRFSRRACLHRHAVNVARPKSCTGAATASVFATSMGLAPAWTRRETGPMSSRRDHG